MQKYNLLQDKGNFEKALTNYDKKNAYESYNSRQFTPESYLMNQNSTDYSEHELQFMNKDNRTDTNAWIYKPTMTAQGIGIKIFKDLDMAKKEFREQKQSKNPQKHDQVIIQKYIKKTQTWNNKKFDLRCYIYLTNLNQGQRQQIYFHPGYFRISVTDYLEGDQEDFSDLSKHLTNVYQQAINNKGSKGNRYDDILRTWAQMNAHLRDDLKFNWFQFENLNIRIRQCAEYLAQSFFNTFDEENYEQMRFQLFGIDIMFDENWDLILLEANPRPLLVNNNDVSKNLHIPLIDGMNTITVENLEKVLYEKEGDNLEKQKIEGLELLFDNTKDFDYIKMYKQDDRFNICQNNQLE